MSGDFESLHLFWEVSKSPTEIDLKNSKDYHNQKAASKIAVMKQLGINECLDGQMEQMQLSS